MISAFLGPLRQHLQSRQITLTFVDIGARNGVLELADVAKWTRAIGCEPNPKEYEKLVAGFSVAPRPPYQSLVYLPYAIGAAPGRTPFYLTPGPGACGIVEPNLELLRGIHLTGRSRNFGDSIFTGFTTTEVEVRTLDQVAGEQGLTHIDYLKIDVEGSEYGIFQGASRLLPQTGVIRVEVSFVQLRKGQPLFSDVDVLLRAYGFELLTYEIPPALISYKVRQAPVQYVPAETPDPCGQAIAADAIYVNRGITDPDRALAQAAALLERGYVDEAAHLLKTTAQGDPAFVEMLRTYQAGVQDHGWAVWAHQSIDRLQAWSQRLKQRLRRS